MEKINYLGSCRKQAGLSQSDISFLVGKDSISTISKIEDDTLLPDLKTAFSFSLLYQKNISELFEKLYEDCSFGLLRKIDCLSSQYAKRNSDVSVSKSEIRKNQVKQDFLKSTVEHIKNVND